MAFLNSYDRVSFCVKLLNFSFRLAVASFICGSLASCSLFRPGENDDETWGDPHWELNGEQGTRADSGTGQSQTGTSSSESVAGQRRLVGSPHDADYWPTTEELESRGGSLSMADYQRTEQAALEAFSRMPPDQATRGPEENNFALNEPALPMPTDDVDPLAGFWEEDDHTDSSIQRAGAQQEDPLLVADTTGDSDVKVPEDGSQPSGALGQQSDSLIHMPIPPSSQPARNESIVGSSEAPPALHRRESENSGLTPDVVLLEARVPATDAAFEDVSLLNDEHSLTIPPPRQDSFLDRRQRLSLSDVNPLSDGPLAAPSIVTAREKVSGNP